MCISFELSLCGFWKSLVSELHTHTVIQRPSNVVSSIPHPFLYTPQWLLGIIGVKILKLHQAHLWVEMDSKVHRLQKHNTPRNRVEKMRNIPLINPHTPGVVDSPDVPSCYSLPFLACFNNRCFTRHPCPLACRWVPPVQDIGWRLERKKNRIRAFLPRLLLPAPARRLSTTATPWLTSLLHLEVCWCDRLLLKCHQAWSTGPSHEDSPTCPTFGIWCTKPPSRLSASQGDTHWLRIQQLNDDSFVKS